MIGEFFRRNSAKIGTLALPVQILEWADADGHPAIMDLGNISTHRNADPEGSRRPSPA